MSDFHFLRPLWFLALPPLLSLLWFLWRRRLRSRSWQEVCDPALLPHLLLGRSRRRANWPLWLLLAAQLTVVTALAGPTWRRLPQPLFQQQSALVICLDLSRSMQAADLKPSRLVRARLKIQDILRQRREGQTALVVFAGDAFAITPLTADYRTIEALLGTLEPELMPVQGSAPARALALGAELLQQAGVKHGTLLLVTDEDRPRLAEAAARRLPEQGMQLQVLGVGTPEGAPIPLATGGFFKDGAGNLVLPGLDEPGLRQLAEAGGGSYRRLSIDDGDFHALLAGLESHRLDQAETTQNRLGDRWEEAGVWLLWPLVLLAACAFRRGWLAVLVLLLLAPPQSHALNWQDLWQRPDQQAEAAFAAGKYEAAADRFEDQRWKASALYRAGRYDEALKALPDSEGGDDWYNRGNALARTGQLAEALKAYDQTLKLKPGDEDALANRKLVEQALQQQKEQQQDKKQQQQQSDGQQGDKEPASADEKPDAHQNPQGQNGSDKQGEDGTPSPETSAEGKQTPPPEEQSAEESNSRPEQADNAQSSSGQEQQQAQAQKAEAGEEQPPQDDAQAVADSAPPSAEERELQQWLQGIPDDPGGLLRRKFLYQYRSRGGQLETDRPW
ncbi:VWA domain-containing protein [Trichloromonas sp.]|uniref:vWA domain-containing protein n=1 Tax=Trichloromonas sp. TaxID=3069249 RepID=UPI003D81511B